jgi:hypothetical protein
LFRWQVTAVCLKGRCSDKPFRFDSRRFGSRAVAFGDGSYDQCQLYGDTRWVCRSRGSLELQIQGTAQQTTARPASPGGCGMNLNPVVALPTHDS